MGLIAWLILFRFLVGKSDERKRNRFSLISFKLHSLGIQIYYIKSLAHIKDWSAIEDIIDAFSLVYLVFVLITVAINLLICCRKKE